MKKKSAPPPTGIDALPKAAAAALPKAAAAALEAPEAPAAPAAHPLLQKLMAGGAKGAEVTKLHLSLEMMPQDPQVGYGSLGDLGIYCQAFDDIPIYSLLGG